MRLVPGKIEKHAVIFAVPPDGEIHVSVLTVKDSLVEPCHSLVSVDVPEGVRVAQCPVDDIRVGADRERNLRLAGTIQIHVTGPGMRRLTGQLLVTRFSQTLHKGIFRQGETLYAAGVLGIRRTRPAQRGQIARSPELRPGATSTFTHLLRCVDQQPGQPLSVCRTLPDRSLDCGYALRPWRNPPASLDAAHSVPAGLREHDPASCVRDSP
ncbi:hypothetical protein STXM2123_3785 [Streptomyces sp. F-3]|nr:hypothetical protein STXM2123_3785 [Streptomyces sp. F-3]